MSPQTLSNGRPVKTHLSLLKLGAYYEGNQSFPEDFPVQDTSTECPVSTSRRRNDEEGVSENEISIV